MKRNLNLGLRASLSDVLEAEAVHMVRTFETDTPRALKWPSWKSGHRGLKGADAA